jgi:nitroreductase
VDIADAIRGRRSIRAYKDEAVPRETIERIIELAGMAPSSHNTQPWRFHVVVGDAREPVGQILSHTTRFVGEYLAKLDPDQAEMAEQFFAELGHAPVLIAVSSPLVDDELETINTLLAVGGAIQNLQLAAHAEGLGSCSITFSYWMRDELADVFGIPDDNDVVSIVLMGPPAEEPVSPGRNSDIASFRE